MAHATIVEKTPLDIVFMNHYSEDVMEKNKPLLIAGSFTLLLLLGFILVRSYQASKQSQFGISPDILYLSSPLYSLSGAVEKVNGNTITITSPSITSLSDVAHLAPQGTNITPFPTLPPQKLRYAVVINTSTTITQPPLSIPYLFHAQTAGLQKKLTIADIHPGDHILVSTPFDIRTISNNVIQASQITLPTALNTINGTVVSINEKQIVVKGVVVSSPFPESQKQKNYTFTINANTEISHGAYISEVGISGKPGLLITADIQPGITAILYANGDVTLVGNRTALRIDPVIPISPESTPISPPQMSPAL